MTEYERQQINHVLVTFELYVAALIQTTTRPGAAQSFLPIETARKNLLDTIEALVEASK